MTQLIIKKIKLIINYLLNTPPCNYLKRITSKKESVPIISSSDPPFGAIASKEITVNGLGLSAMDPKHLDIRNAMTKHELNPVKNLLLIALLASLSALGCACTVQWAFRNKNTDCGLFKDMDQKAGRPDRLDITVTQEGYIRPATPSRP